MKKGTLFIVTAPSGAGKTTLVTNVLARLEKDYSLRRVITYTTKKPRPAEVNGVDYHFTTEAEFKEKINDGFFVEHSTAYGAYYGFPQYVLKDIEDGIHHVAILDRAGAEALKAHQKNAVLIFIKPPSKGDLQLRLATRAQDTEEDIAHRLRLAEWESERHDELFEHIIINNDLEKAIRELELLIISKM